MKSIVTILLLLIGVSAEARQCVTISRIRDFRYMSRNTLELRVGRHERWSLETYSCPDLRWAESLAYDTRPRGSMQLCVGDSIIPLDAWGRALSSIPCSVRSVYKKN